MRFWDSSAVLPLVVSESSSSAMRALLDEDPVVVVWWATQTECASALARLERDGAMQPRAVEEAFRGLDVLAAAWSEVQPVEPVRRAARRLLRVHPLRAADALQLAAATAAAEGDPGSLPMVTLDEQLAVAARREGFAVLST